MRYLVIVRYENDAERKRVDYLLEKWSEKTSIKKPKGLIFFIDTDRPHEFLEDLFSKLEGEPERKVEVYKVEGTVRGVEKRSVELRYKIPEEKRVVERFIEYILTKFNANVLQKIGGSKVYEVPTRKGRGTVQVELKENNGTEVIITIQGYGDVVDFLSERIKEELTLFAGD